ncbi:hypothetical protein DH2020_035702 [Rehmannia glutinosa]|uniref:Protein kinase domain-containing protein n=1 Tax=Rehmannia glutinosa TaxID=99300 RepID=A0ABR0V8V7_REHGL
MDNSCFSSVLSLLLLLNSNTIVLCLATTFNINSTNTDQISLLAFKKTITSDPYAILAKNWSENVSVCHWIGVTCGIKHQRVISLNISRFDFSGTLSPHLGNLTFLRYLDISSNNFTGNIPSELSHLHRLRRINLGFNTFTGEIPSWFGALPRLQQLILKNNTFSGRIPGEIGNSNSSLEIVNLDYNQLTGSIPYGIFNISSIREITIMYNYILGTLPSDICNNLPNLVRLALSGNQLEGRIPSNIRKCRNIEVLSLSINRFNGKIPSEIGSLRPIPNQIMNCTSLKYLRLANNYLTGELPQEHGNLRSLEFFSVYNNSLSGSIPSSMFKIPTLKVLELSYNQFSGSLHLPWNLSFSNLEELYLHTNGLTGEIPSSITNASKLTILDMNENSFSGSIPDFGNLRLLQWLNLRNNNLSGSTESPNQELGFISSLTNCQNLTFLEISENPLNGILPASIGNLSTSLQMLRARDCNIKGVIPDGIGNLSSLLRISLSQNELTGLISPKNRKINATAKIISFLGIVCGIASLKVINGIDLSSNKLSGYIPSSIDGCQSLEFLSLSNNKFEGSIPESLGNVRGLSSLDLSNNNLSGLIPKSLENLRFLQYFNVSYNKLEGEIPTNGSFVNFTAQSFVNNSALCGETKFRVPHCTEMIIRRSIRRKNVVRFMKYILPPFILAIILVIVIVVLTRKRKLNKIPPLPDISPNIAWRRVSYIEIVRGTNGFSETNLLGKGGFAIDVALALEYLHHGHTFPVVHCDIKPNNVLLDEDMTAHLGDFGIAKLFDEGETMVQTKTLATIGYAAPEYGSEGKVSTNGDVYSYGILLLEIFTRKKPTNDMFSEEMSLKDWVHEALQENSVTEIVAPDLLAREDQHLRTKEECVSSIFSLAVKCLALLPEERTNMIQIVALSKGLKPKLWRAPASTICLVHDRRDNKHKIESMSNMAYIVSICMLILCGTKMMV